MGSVLDGEAMFGAVLEVDAVDRFVSALAWHADGACVDHPDLAPDAWFPRRGESAAAAQDVCRRCLVRVECAAYALADQVEHGVWGSTTPRQRRRAQALGLTVEELFAEIDRPPAAATTQGASRCDRCGGALSRSDQAGAHAKCWACRPALAS